MCRFQKCLYLILRMLPRKVTGFAEKSSSPFGAQTNIESDKHQVADKHRVRQTSSQTNIESDKHRVRQTSSQTNIELISKNKCLLRQTSSQTNTEYLTQIYKIWSTGTNIKLDIHRVRQTSSQTNIESDKHRVPY